MATRYYIVGGAYYTWEQLHNQFGYTDHETSNISYKSAHPTTWGESAGSGYFDGDQTDMVNGSFWSDEDNTAWHTLNSLALDVEVYPADATDCAMEKGGVRSDAVSIESDGVTYYLIRDVWDSGWMSESEAAAEGWEPAQPGPILPVVYTHTGTQTAASIAPDASFDTGLTYDSNNLYIGETDDGLGDVTRYGWEVEEGPEPPAYTEITLYMSVGSNLAQRNVTSAFTGDVNTNGSFSYALYTNAECTVDWKGYDYSNDYQVGHYVGGKWVRYPDSISDLPSTTTSESSEVKWACVLLDLNRLWVCCNYSPTINYSVSLNYSIVVRVIPKAQQHYAFYLGAANAYGNANVSNNNTNSLKGFPGGSSAQTVPWDVQDATLPTRIIQKLLGSARNELSQSGVGWRDPSLGYKFYQIANASGASISLRAVVFTLSKPTLYGWLNSDKTDKSHGTNMISFIYDESGNAVQYDPAFTYRVIGIFKSNGDAATNSWASVSGEILEQESGTNNLQIRRNYSGTITISKVWYIKEVINPIETTFGAAVTIPAGYEVESVTCSRGYVFASSVTNSGTVVDYELPGEKVYFDDTNTGLIGVKVRPALQITVINTLSHTVVATLSNKYGDTAASPETASASYVNSGGFFVKGTAKYSDSIKSSNVANAMQQFPVYFNLADSSGNWLYFCFDVPHTLWQFQNGVFTWLGDTTDVSDLAYWYNTRAVRINLRPITT